MVLIALSGSGDRHGQVFISSSPQASRPRRPAAHRPAAHRPADRAGQPHTGHPHTGQPTAQASRPRRPPAHRPPVHRPADRAGQPTAQASRKGWPYYIRWQRQWRCRCSGRRHAEGAYSRASPCGWPGGWSGVGGLGAAGLGRAEVDASGGGWSGGGWPGGGCGGQYQDSRSAIVVRWSARRLRAARSSGGWRTTKGQLRRARTRASQSRFFV